MVNSGDGRVRLEWAPEVIEAAFDAGWMLDPNGYLAPVAVMITDVVDEFTTRELRSLHKDGHPRLMLVATTIDDAALVAAAEAGVAGLLRRGDASADTMVRTIVKVASGDGEVPADLLGRLLEQVGRLQRQVLAPRGLTPPTHEWRKHG